MKSGGMLHILMQYCLCFISLHLLGFYLNRYYNDDNTSLPITHSIDSLSSVSIRQKKNSKLIAMDYPEHIFVPRQISDEQLIRAANNRVGGRIPSLCWSRSEGRAFLFRGACSDCLWTLFGSLPPDQGPHTSSSKPRTSFTRCLA